MASKQFFNDERALVRQASSDPVAREKLRRSLRDPVTVYVLELMKSRGIADARESELLALAMNMFDLVFNVYLKNGGLLHTEEGHFYDYYNWWVRQAIVKATT